MFKHACHTKFLTFGGTFIDQMSFQTFSFLQVWELSPLCCCATLKATRYADLTEKLCPLFSFHITLSSSSILVSGIAKISWWVSTPNRAVTFPQSHCLVCQLMSSYTCISLRISPFSLGGWVSHAWDDTFMVFFVSNLPPWPSQYNLPCWQQATPNVRWIVSHLSLQEFYGWEISSLLDTIKQRVLFLNQLPCLFCE